MLKPTTRTEVTLVVASSLRLPACVRPLARAGVIPVAAGEEEMDEYVLEYLSGYIAECHASGEDLAAFSEVSQSTCRPTRCARFFRCLC